MINIGIISVSDRAFNKIYEDEGIPEIEKILSTDNDFNILKREIIPDDKKRSLGQFYIVFKPNAAISLNVFIKRMQDLTSQVRRQKAKIKKNKVMMPNDPEILNMKARVKRGIPLDNNTFKEMKALSKKFSIDLKLLN